MEEISQEKLNSYWDEIQNEPEEISKTALMIMRENQELEITPQEYY